MKRRDIVKILPTSLSIAALPSALKASMAEDPILTHYRDWLAARAEWYSYADLPGHEHWDTPEMLAAQDAEDVALEAMMATKPTTFEGVAALAHAIWVWKGVTLKEDHPEYPDQCDMIENRLLIALWRAASGREDFPAVTYSS